MDTCLHLRTCTSRSGGEHCRAAAEIAERRGAGCRTPRQMRPRVSIASVPKWSWSVICVGAGPSRIILLSPLFYLRSLSPILFISSFLSISLASRAPPSTGFLDLSSRTAYFIPRFVSSYLILFRCAVHSRSAFAFLVCLLSDTRDIHIYTHGNTQCHSVKLLPVGKAKISLQAAVRLEATILRHRRHHIVQCKQVNAHNFYAKVTNAFLKPSRRVSKARSCSKMNEKHFETRALMFSFYFNYSTREILLRASLCG